MIGEESQNQRTGNLCFIIARIAWLSCIFQTVFIASIGVQCKGHVASARGMARDANTVRVHIIDIIMYIIHQLQHAQTVIAATDTIGERCSRGTARAVCVHVEYHKAAARKLYGCDVLRFQRSMITVAGDYSRGRVILCGRGGPMHQNAQCFAVRHRKSNIRNGHASKIRLDQACADATDKDKND